LGHRRKGSAATALVAVVTGAAPTRWRLTAVMAPTVTGIAFTGVVAAIVT
jgi:hypothetical protein